MEISEVYNLIGSHLFGDSRFKPVIDNFLSSDHDLGEWYESFGADAIKDENLKKLIIEKINNFYDDREGNSITVVIEEEDLADNSDCSKEFIRDCIYEEVWDDFYDDYDYDLSDAEYFIDNASEDIIN